MGKTLNIKFNGYGNKVVSASVEGKKYETKAGKLIMSKNDIPNDVFIVLKLEC